MSDLSPSGLNDAATDFVARVAHLSLHSADPGTTGASETSAGRQVPSMSASGGVASLSSALNFTGGAASGACTYVGAWDSTPTFLGKAQITTGDLTFNAAGDYTLDNVSWTFA